MQRLGFESRARFSHDSCLLFRPTHWRLRREAVDSLQKVGWERSPGAWGLLRRRGLSLAAVGLVAIFVKCNGSTRPSGTSAPEVAGESVSSGPTTVGGVGGGMSATTNVGDAGATGNGGVATTLDGSLPTGSTGAGMAGDSGDSPAVCGGVVCNDLPNVAPDATSYCENDLCVVPSEGCVSGYGSCTDEPTSACETPLRSSTDCGACGNVCPASEPLCTRIDGEFTCSSACVSETPDFCDGCVDLATSLTHCGACDTPCESSFNEVRCVEGQCEHGDCYPGAERCAGMEACESLNTPANCGACGRDDCGAENATPDCTNPDSCAAVTCVSGWANCDRTSPDCETEFGGGCTPSYVGTLHLEPSSTPVVAVATDSVTWLAGALIGEADLDPSAGTDVHAPTDFSTFYVTKLNSDGSYAWSFTIGTDSANVVNGVAAGPSGSVLVTGTFSDTLDFDPGQGVLELGEENTSEQAFLARYSADGELVWAHAWPGRTEGLQVASDSSGGIYLSGSFGGSSKDLDPGSGTDEFDAQHAITGFVVKLDAAGEYQWGDVRRLELRDIATSADSVWTVGDSFDSGVWHYPSGVRQTFWSEFFATRLTLSGSIVTAGGTVSGTSFSPPDFPETRLVLYRHTAGALLRMQDDGTYLGVTVLVDETFVDLAPAPGDGVVALTETGSVLGYELDGTSVYRFQSGAGAGTTQIAETPDGFLLVGSLASAADMDPGPSIDTIEPGGFVSEFRF